MTGDPLSAFTDKFQKAALRKTEGVVYYSDIISTLRDEFLSNDSQTPFFFSQGTGREQFVADAGQLASLRDRLMQSDTKLVAPLKSTPPALIERLKIANSKVASPGVMDIFLGNLFDALNAVFAKLDFSEYFYVEKVEHADFREPTTERFIIRTLMNEKRRDNFVTADYYRAYRNKNRLFAGLGIDNDYDDVWTLKLNCSLKSAQVRLTLTPRFVNLQRIVLVVSCAPSLDHCYVFEKATQHMLKDFGVYDDYGSEISHRWWKAEWSSSPAGIADQIAETSGCYSRALRRR